MNQIKTVFVGLFYSAIVPTGLVVTAVAMVTFYWVDKYSLLRQWKRPPVSEKEGGICVCVDNRDRESSLPIAQRESPSHLAVAVAVAVALNAIVDVAVAAVVADAFSGLYPTGV